MKRPSVYRVALKSGAIMFIKANLKLSSPDSVFYNYYVAEELARDKDIVARVRIDQFAAEEIEYEEV